MWRRCSRLARAFSSKPGTPLDISEYARQIPDAVSKPQHLDEELDWSHLKQNGMPHEDGSGVTEQKEEMIFKEVLSHVLSSQRKPAPSPRGESKTPLSDSILALFEKSDTTPQPSQNPRSGAESLLDGLLNPRAADPVILAKEKQKRERANAILANVYQHIDQLPTNKDVLEYFESVALPLYDTALPKDSPATACPVDRPLVNAETVAYILEKCIIALAKDFKDPVGAIHLFETAKHHSVEVFTEACTADVYNQIISIRWYEYRDLYSVVNLAAEIAINAILPSLETTELLANIYRDAVDSSKGLGKSPYGMPLWTRQEERRILELNRYRMRFQSAWASKPDLRF